MNESEFKKLNALAEVVFSNIEALEQSGAWEKVLDQMAMTARDLPENFSVSLKFNLDVFDSEREKDLTLLSTGFACSPGHPPYEVSDESTIQRYVVDGDICQVPHDYCPRCWGGWDFKLKNPACPECGAMLGEDVKLLLDSDVCPHCERGKVTMNHPVCTECGLELEAGKVVWG